MKLNVDLKEFKPSGGWIESNEPEDHLDIVFEKIRLNGHKKRILCFSYKDKTLTEVAATCISYKDYQTNKIRRSFSFQFHPELLSDLREFHLSGKHDYNLFKNDDGIRMLMRVLYESVLE